MNLATGPVHRPILTTMIFLVIITLGVISFSRLSVDLMPEITYPAISVITSYGNVGPQEMEELITRPIEEALAAVQGVEEISSSSSEGRSSVRVYFTWGTDLEEASNDIRDRIDRVLGRLPEDIERPMIRKFDLSAFPILIMGVASDMNPLDLRQMIEDQVKYRLERVPGVAAMDIWGGLNREIHVELKAAQLKALGISPGTVLAALQRENRNVPAGLYEKGNLEVLVRTQGEYRSLDEIRQTVIALRQGSPIRIADVAEVQDSWEEVRRITRINGQPGVRISVNKQSGANTVSVAREVLAEVERINRDIPQMSILPVIDTSKYIQQSINNVGRSILIGGILAIFILFLFLRNISSTAIIATAIPISVVATFGLMYFGGFTLNIMTFGALALGIGMLVDSSIVVLENTYRHREAGQSPTDSALAGSSEVSSAIIASTLTTLVVFLPVVFIRGMSGIMFRQMAYVVSFSLLCALVVALTLVPMLSSRFLHFTSGQNPGRKGRLHRVYMASEAAFRRVEKRYAELLDWALHHRKTVVFSTFALFVVSVILVRLVGVELMPQADEGEVRVSLEMAVGTRLEVVDQATLAVEEIVRREVPEMSDMMSRAGGGGWGSSGGHTAEVRITLVPKGDRKRSSEQVANALRRALAGLPGVTVRTRAGQGLFLLSMGTSGGDNIGVEVRGYDLETAQRLALQVDQVVKQVPGITDTRISREEGSPEQIIRIDRQKASDLGLTVTDIGDALQTAVGGTYASYYREGGKEYRILVRLSEEDRNDLAELLDLTVINNRGEPVILRNVVAAVPKEGPVSLQRKDQERIITIDANFTGRDMGSVVSDIRKGLRAIPVPKDFAILFGQEYEEQQKAFRELMFGLVLALFLIYMVMAGQFESFRDPFVVLFSIPMALIGVVLTMILTNTIFSMQAFIGCIMLAGIVVNNAILLVDYTNQLRRREKMDLMAAIRLSGARRLRPILMTTLTTVLGLFPLSLGLGEGGEAQAPLARVVIGGLLSSTLITLVLIPVVYSVFERRLKGGLSLAGLRRALGGKSQPAPASQGGVA
jgi:HAE1 family hydrophobic/amphiphilic exporter-1